MYLLYSHKIMIIPVISGSRHTSNFSILISVLKNQNLKLLKNVSLFFWLTLNLFWQIHCKSVFKNILVPPSMNCIEQVWEVKGLWPLFDHDLLVRFLSYGLYRAHDFTNFFIFSKIFTAFLKQINVNQLELMQIL